MVMNVIVGVGVRSRMSMVVRMSMLVMVVPVLMLVIVIVRVVVRIAVRVAVGVPVLKPRSADALPQHPAADHGNRQSRHHPQNLSDSFGDNKSK
jgi:hypothetical protein